MEAFNKFKWVEFPNFLQLSFSIYNLCSEKNITKGVGGGGVAGWAELEDMPGA